MNFKFCPNCGTKGSVAAENLTHYVCGHCGWVFWNNAKAAVAVVFINDKDELLYAKLAAEPDKGKFGLPGGFVDYGEDLFDAAAREIKEETSVDIRPEDLTILAQYADIYIPGVSVVDVVLVVGTWTGTFNAADDVAELVWRPFSFMKDPQFRPDYQGLEENIKGYLAA